MFGNFYCVICLQTILFLDSIFKFATILYQLQYRKWELIDGRKQLYIHQFIHFTISKNLRGDWGSMRFTNYLKKYLDIQGNGKIFRIL